LYYPSVLRINPECLNLLTGMDNNSTQTEQLIRFIENELSREERLHVEGLIARNPIIKKEYDRLLLSRNLGSSYGLEQNLHQLHNKRMSEIKADEHPVPEAVIRPLSWYIPRTAASIVLIILVSFFYQYLTATSEKLYHEIYSPYQLSRSRFASGSLMDSLFAVGNTRELVLQFENNNQHSLKELFLAGNSYLSENKPAKAIECFQLLAKQNLSNQSHVFEEDAAYYLALAFLKNNEPSKALPILQSIHGNPKHAYHGNISSWQIRKLKWIE
jgi:hypothetical protein